MYAATPGRPDKTPARHPERTPARYYPERTPARYPERTPARYPERTPGRQPERMTGLFSFSYIRIEFGILLNANVLRQKKNV
jgi:hypothetical protein